MFTIISQQDRNVWIIKGIFSDKKSVKCDCDVFRIHTVLWIWYLLHILLTDILEHFSYLKVSSKELWSPASFRLFRLQCLGGASGVAEPGSSDALFLVICLPMTTFLSHPGGTTFRLIPMKTCLLPLKCCLPSAEMLPPSPWRLPPWIFCLPNRNNASLTSIHTKVCLVWYSISQKGYIVQQSRNHASCLHNRLSFLANSESCLHDSKTGFFL